MARVERIGVSVPPKLLKRFDDTVRKIGYEDRSKALHVAMRDFIADYTWTMEEEKVGTGAILLTYSHRSHGLQEVLTDIQHQYRNLINSVTHVHLDESQCLEIICVRGRTERIQKLARNVMKRRGITQLKLTIVGL